MRSLPLFVARETAKAETEPQPLTLIVRLRCQVGGGAYHGFHGFRSRNWLFLSSGASTCQEKSREGATPNGFFLRLPARHCSGSAASVPNPDATWLMPS